MLGSRNLSQVLETSKDNLNISLKNNCFLIRLVSQYVGILYSPLSEADFFETSSECRDLIFQCANEIIRGRQSFEFEVLGAVDST